MHPLPFSIMQAEPIWTDLNGGTDRLPDFGKLTTADREITARCIDILNRADPDLYQFMQYGVNACDFTLGENYALAKQFG